MEKHILFTARDIGAAQQIKYIIKAFDKSGFKISVIASGVAYKFLIQEGLNPLLFSIDGDVHFLDTNASESKIESLIKTSYKIIKRI